MLMATGSLKGFDLQRAVLAVEGLSAAEKTVLLVLSVMANENGQAWPGINGPTGLTTKCSLSERSVQRAIQTLKDAGHIKRDEKRGCGVVYTVTPVTVAPLSDSHPRQDDTPVSVAPTPVTVAPKQPRTTNTSEAKASSVVKSARIAVDWQPAKPYPSNVAALVALWPPGREEREIDGFRDYWLTRSRDACKTDWDKTFHNRIRDQHDRIIRENRYVQRTANDRPDEIQNVRLRAAVKLDAERAGGQRHAGF